MRKTRQQNKDNTNLIYEELFPNKQQQEQGKKPFEKARLTEDKMMYEDLAVLDNFSDEEITFALNRQNIKDRKDKLALQKAKILK